VSVNFALFLSPDGIALAHRQPAGHWALVAEARPEGEDLDGAMAAIRDAAQARGWADAPVLLVLPDDQVLYTSFMAPAQDAELVAARIAEGLDGLTPYAVADLVHDWRAVEEDRVKVAVVARETLDEAKGFARAHGFASAGYAAMPPAERFPAMPFFGNSAAELGLDAAGMAFGSDDWVAPEPEPEPGPEVAVATAVEAGADPDVTVAQADGTTAGISETDGDAAEAAPVAEPDGVAAGTDAPPTDGAAAEADAAAPEVSEDTAPEVEAEARDTGADVEATPEKADDHSAEDGPRAGDVLAAEAGISAAPETAPEAEELPEPPLSAIFDPTLEQPIAPIDEDSPTSPAPLSATEEAEEGAESADATTPDAGAVTSEVPESGRAGVAEAAGKGNGAKARRAPRSDAAQGKGIAPAATAQDMPVPAGEEDPFPSSEADGGAEIPARNAADDGTYDATGDGEDSAGKAAPLPSFAPRRGKVAKPEGVSGDLLSTRPSRLGFGGAAQGPARAPAVLHPDATVGPTATAPIKPGARLAAQLARVRDASKLPPQEGAARRPIGPATPPATVAAPITGSGGGVIAPERSAGQGAAAVTQDAPRKAGAGSLVARLGLGRGQAGDSRAVEADAGARAGTRAGSGAGEEVRTDGTAAFSNGLLARKPVEAVGPSFRTGLILTVILLVLLALIAIWSALFLPDSPIARLLGGGDRETLATGDAPQDAPAIAPVAVTAPPAMGERDTGSPAPEAEAPEVATESAPEIAAEAPEPEATSVVAEAPAVPVLPDIDADLDLPPLPPLPEERLPSLEETERIYAEDGIWARTPERPVLAALSSANDIYLASIDPEVPVTDAIALADPVLDHGEILRRVPPPPPFGVTPDRDARGLVTPTPEGVLTPEGAFVISGRPVVDAIPRPREVVTEPAPALPQIDVDDAILRTVQPTPRPLDLEETRERQVLGGFSASELAALRPDQRPASAQEAAAQASLFPGAGAATDTDAALGDEVEIAGSALAIATSRQPLLRPGDLTERAAAVQEAAAETAPAVPQEAIARAPAIPSNADVARAATERNAIRLRNVNLIGVSGTPNDRRALVRLPSGRFVRVGVGDRLDGGRVAAIGESSLQYVLNGRNVTLEIPG
jgi:hypothetical protein